LKFAARQIKRLPLIRFSAARLRRLRKVRGVFVQVLVLCGIKVAVHFWGLEQISINPLFSAMVASTIFLLGFLLNGVLTDFKESEKIPGELATSLQTLNLEIQAIQTYHPEAQIAAALSAVTDLGQSLLDWLKEKISTDQMLARYTQIHSEVVRAAMQFNGDASTLKGRLMQDLAVILAKINRVQAIRDTSFVPLVYWMADIASALLFAGLVMARAENLSESVFFLAVISFVVLLLLRLINDIDNPFGLSNVDSAENVSIELLEKAVKNLGADAS
jgi:predicted membrane chloride channel (bestrophin family)